MRILMLTQFYPPIIGGEERQVKNLSVKLCENKHDVSVATIWQKGAPRFELDKGVRVYRLNSTLQRASFLFKDKHRAGAPPFPDPELTWRLWQIVKREQPHIVHAHNWMIYSFLPIKRWSKAKLVLSLHDKSFNCSVKNRINQETLCYSPPSKKCIECASRRYGSFKGTLVVGSHLLMGPLERAAVDMFVADNHCYAEDNGLIAKGLPLKVIQNFIPDDICMVVEDPHPHLTSKLPVGEFILFVGAFSRFKGVDTLIAAYREIKGAPPLVIIGYKTMDMPVLKAQLPESMTVLMDWPHEAVMVAWQRCLFGVVPSLYSDPIPTVALEGMASGKALVASRVDSLPNLVVDGKTGFVVDPGDPDKLRRAMERLINEAETRKRMGDEALRKVVGYQASKIVPQIEELYSDLLRSHP